MSVVVVDSGVANLASVQAALHRLGVEAHVTADANQIARADHVVLPGVGAAAAAMAQLRDKKLVECLRGLTQPVLGICLGMQLLFEGTAESGGVDCLGVLSGRADLLPSASDMPVPHMGWNQLNLQKPEHPLLRDVAPHSYVYFVHSYAVPVRATTLASVDYSKPFTGIVGDRNFFGCQFHPERSGAVGSQILKNFLGM